MEFSLPLWAFDIIAIALLAPGLAVLILLIALRFADWQDTQEDYDLDNQP